MLPDKIVGKNIFHVAGIEQCVVDSVDLRVKLGILDSLGNILYSHHLSALACHKVGYRACTGIQIVHQLVAGETGKVTCHLI